jgi:hypothetical protein
VVWEIHTHHRRPLIDTEPRGGRVGYSHHSDCEAGGAGVGLVLVGDADFRWAGAGVTDWVNRIAESAFAGAGWHTLRSFASQHYIARRFSLSLLIAAGARCAGHQIGPEQVSRDQGESWPGAMTHEAGDLA